MAGEITQSTSSSSSSSTPSAIQTPQSDWGLQLSQLLAAIAQNYYSWASDNFNKGMAITDQNIAQYHNEANVAGGLANQILQNFTGTIMPLMNTYNTEAASYASPARQAFEAGKAESTVAQSDQAAIDSAQRQLQGFGVNPNSGRYQDLIQASRTADAAARAGAGTAASLAAQQTGRQMQENVIGWGQNEPGFIANSLNAELQGLGGAQNAETGMLNTGANLANVGTNAAGVAAAANRLPPVGNTSRSASGSQSSGQPAPSNGAGGGGGSTSSGNRFGSGFGGDLTQGGGGAPFLEVKNTSPGAGDTTDPFGTLGTGVYGSDPTNPPFDPNYAAPGDPTFGNPQMPDWSGGAPDFGSNPLPAQDPNAPGSDYGGALPTLDPNMPSGPVDVSGGDAGASFAHGGVIPTTGGYVPPSASPSQGRQTDDIPARLNAHEFVIPKDVVHHRGTRFFNKLIESSRRERTGMSGPPAKPKMKPALNTPPTFTSYHMGGHNG